MIPFDANLFFQFAGVKDQKEWNIISEQQDRASFTLLLSLVQKSMII